MNPQRSCKNLITSWQPQDRPNFFSAQSIRESKVTSVQLTFVLWFPVAQQMRSFCSSYKGWGGLVVVDVEQLQYPEYNSKTYHIKKK